MNEVLAGLVGIVFGAAATGLFAAWRDSVERREQRQRDLRQTRRDVYLRANRHVVAMIEAANDYVTSWHGHQPDAPQHDMVGLLRQANSALVDVSLLAQSPLASASESLREAVQGARDIEFWDDPDSQVSTWEKFMAEATSQVAPWQAELRRELAIDA